MSDNLSALLDANLDDLVDLPEFVVPPAGAYNATILSFEEKKIGEHPAIEIKFKLNETLELANPADTPIKEGLETNISYMLDNDFGVGALKEFLKPFRNHFGTTTTRETLEATRGVAVMLVTKVRKGTGDKADKTYLGIHKVEVL